MDLISLIYLLAYALGIVAVAGLLFMMFDEWRERA
jgi:hypothetical protein